MKWPFGKSTSEGGLGGDADIDSYMKEITMGTGKMPEEDKYTYLKSMRISGEADLERVSKELRKGNLVMLNIAVLFQDKARLRSVVEKTKALARETRGDLCKVSNEKLLLVPEGMEIVA